MGIVLETKFELFVEFILSSRFTLEIFPNCIDLPNKALSVCTSGNPAKINPIFSKIDLSISSSEGGSVILTKTKKHNPQ